MRRHRQAANDSGARPERAPPLCTGDAETFSGERPAPLLVRDSMATPSAVTTNVRRV